MPSRQERACHALKRSLRRHHAGFWSRACVVNVSKKSVCILLEKLTGSSPQTKPAAVLLFGSGCAVKREESK